MTGAQDTQRQVVEVIFAHLPVRARKENVNANTSLFGSGGLNLDSFAVVELIALLESQLDIQFLEEDFRTEYFQNIGTLCALIERRKQP